MKIPGKGMRFMSAETEFDVYAAGLIKFAVAADDTLASVKGNASVLWADSFTRDILSILTADDDDLKENACGGAIDGDHLSADDFDAETIREGMIERFTDDVLCALPDGYLVGTDADTGAPIVGKVVS